MTAAVINVDDTNAYAAGVEQAAAALRAGELVIFPTETVYGVGANGASAAAVARLADAKGRTETQPFTVHLGQRRHARRYLNAPSPVARRLMRKGWPGPLTLVCRESAPTQTEVAALCPPEQLAALYRDGKIGLRCPDHPVAARLLTAADVPVVASSANRHGMPPPLDAADALRDLSQAVRYALDAGRTRHHAASTIVAVEQNSWRVVRSGALDERTIERMARTEIVFVCTGNSCRSPMAEALFRRELGQRLGLSADELTAAGYSIISAGTSAARDCPASAGARDELARRGLDLSGHRSQPLTVELLHRAERIFVMSPEHRQAALELLPAAGTRVALLDPAGAVADPFGGPAEQYRVAAEQIQKAVQLRVEEFVHEDRDW
jgi:tRNA threonylcarbamoyl adenosine modification protein (Sua5/YciO/YrdC/YwlC family)